MQYHKVYYVGRVCNGNRKSVFLSVRLSIRLSVLFFSNLNRARDISILNVTYQGAACDTASVHFRPIITRTKDIFVTSYYKSRNYIPNNGDKEGTLFLYIYIYLLFSSHGIAMPKGLYFIAVVSSFFFLSSFFFRRLISEVTERISTKLGHILTYDCYLKNLVRNPLAFTPQAGGKNLISATEHDINNRKKICQSTDTPLHAPENRGITILAAMVTDTEMTVMRYYFARGSGCEVLWWICIVCVSVFLSVRQDLW